MAKSLQTQEQSYRESLWEGAFVETKIIETPGKDLDFDQMNEDMIAYSRYTGQSHQ